MDIENKIKVDRDSAPFKWVKNMVITVGTYILNPDKREDEINAIMMLTCFHLMKDLGKDPQTMKPGQILEESFNYLPHLILLYSQVYLTKKEVEFTFDISTAIQNKIIASQIDKKFNFILMDRINGNMTPFEMFSSIDCLSFGNDVIPKFIEDLCIEYIPFKPNVKIIEELESGMDVCGCTLISLVSKTDMSEIWKAKNKTRDVALKIENLDLEGKNLKNMLKSSSFEKIIDHIKETDLEYLAFQKLKDFPYKVDFMYIDYYNPLNKKVKIIPWLEGPVDKVKIENKKQFIENVIEILYELHKRKIVFNNISPHHIMIKVPTGKYGDAVLSNRIRLVDYKNIVNFKGSDGFHEDTYRSFALLSGTTMVTPYDDIESFFFVINTLINGEISYTDLNDERLKKGQLTSFSHLVSDAIIKLRTLRQNDIYANNLETHLNNQEYINNIYKIGIQSSQTGEIIPGIISIVMDFISMYKEIPEINISLTRTDAASLKNIRSQFASDHRFSNIVSNPSKFNDISIKILNFMNTSVEYSDEDQMIINQFLSG